MIPIVRIKQHTDFRSPHECGLLKMLVIGLDKHRDGTMLHERPFREFSNVLSAIGQLVLPLAAVSFGIALVEDSYGDAAVVEAVLAEQISPNARHSCPSWRRDGRQAAGGVSRRPRRAGDEQERLRSRYGSGRHRGVLHAGGRGHNRCREPGRARPHPGAVCNASEIGRFAAYTNHVTAHTLAIGEIAGRRGEGPGAVAVAVRTLYGVEPHRSELAWMRITLELSMLMVTEPLWQELAHRADLTNVASSTP